MFYGFFCFLAYLLMPSLPLVKDVKEQKATFLIGNYLPPT